MTTRDIRGLADIEPHFDGLIIDQFGVLHDGVNVYAEVLDGLERLHAAGKRMVVLSNSGRRGANNQRRMAAIGLPMARFEAVITSGEVAWESLRRRDDRFHRSLGNRCVLIAAPGDAEFLDGLDLRAVEAAEAADFVLAVSIGEAQSNIAAFGPLLETAARRGLPFLCTNNDVVRPAGAGRVLPAPGALAERYRDLGGAVREYGKPLRAIFDRSLEALRDVRPERVLVVGDSLDHDIAGARNAELGSVLIRSGIGSVGPQSSTAAPEAAADADRNARLRADIAKPTYAMERFRW